MPTLTESKSRSTLYLLVVGLAVIVVGGIIVFYLPKPPPLVDIPRPKYQPRFPLDLSGFSFVTKDVEPWLSSASLEDVAKSWDKIGFRLIEAHARELANPNLDADTRLQLLVAKAMLHNYEAQAIHAYQSLEQARTLASAEPELEGRYLFTIIYAQGVTALRRGEDENCIMCRGESSCIFPINKAAVHVNPLGSRLAVKHFTEYLDEFPDDLEVRWLLNVAHMTLGEHPHKVDPKVLLRMDAFEKSEFDIGQFRDVWQNVGVARLNQAGGVIMEDFHGNGLLDIAITSWDPTEPMVMYRNKGDGTFEEQKDTGLGGQLGGLNCVQTDYRNSGRMDIFVPRGAWLKYAIRPSLLRNDGKGRFTDVTKEAGLADAMNSVCGKWADFDNDGFLDLYFCGEKQPSRLFRNKADGTFEDATAKAGLPTETRYCKAAVWLDFDNDGHPDLFLNYFPDPDAPRTAALFRNNGNGTFTDVTKQMGIDGPHFGFSAWAFDFDNDGFIDIFATSYDRSLKDIVLGMEGKPHTRKANKLFRNVGGKKFEDVTKEAGLDMVFATMGSNFADFDNDGFLDIYLGTGEPNLATLVPNRMFKNVAGKRFAEITSSSRTGHLQKGHGVACGDWRRTGNIDIFIETGGATNGDKYHNVLFQNPGQGNHWLTVKLIGAATEDTKPHSKKTNRAAIGARIKAVTAEGLVVQRHVTSGSSFGANPLQQTLGLAKGTKVKTLEITWPTSGTTQVFRDVAINQAIEITEFAKEYRILDWKPLPAPK